LMVRTLTSEKEYIEGLLNAHIRSLWVVSCPPKIVLVP
jgi:hypothetical protein